MDQTHHDTDLGNKSKLNAAGRGKGLPPAAAGAQKPGPKPNVPQSAAPVGKPPAKSANTEAKPVSGQVITGDTHKSGFFNMITSYLGFLNLRKQAYTGKPASAMYYDEKLGRYIIEGEELSEDEEPPPPPTGKSKLTSAQNNATTTQASSDQAPAQTSASGADSLTSVGFAGALANRGRGRGGAGRGRGAQRAPIQSSFPTGPTQEVQSEPVSAETEKLTNGTQLYQTALDINEDSQPKVESPKETKQVMNKSQLVDISALNETQIEPSEGVQFDEKREAMWQAIYTKQQTRIKQQKQKIVRQQEELARQREENEQTIENFTQLCQDLKFRGMDEVEDLQGQITLLQNTLRAVTEKLAEEEFKNEKLDDKIKSLQSRYESQVLPTADSGCSSLVELPLPKPQSIVKTYDLAQSKANLDTLLDLYQENDKLKWQISSLQIDQSNLLLDFHKLSREHNDCRDLKQNLAEAQLEVQAQQEALRKIKEDTELRTQEDIKKENTEKQNMQQLINKLSQEKDKLQETARVRQKELENKLMNGQKVIATQEQQLKQAQLEISGQVNQVKRLQTEVNQLNGQVNTMQYELQQKDTTIHQIQADKQQEHEQLQAFKKSEKEKMEQNKRQWKDQVQQLENILSNKDETLKELSRQKHEVEQQMEQILTQKSEKKEVNLNEQKLQQQLQQQTESKQMLAEKIAFLQNEIKKRDEMLHDSDMDEDSDHSFTDDDGENDGEDSDHIKAQMMTESRELPKSIRKTTQNIFKDQLTECRVQLQEEIGRKIKAEAACRGIQESLAKSKEGLSDILTILKDIQHSQNFISETQQSTFLDSELMGSKTGVDPSSSNEHLTDSDASDEQADGDQCHDLIQQIITKLFEVQRSFQEQISDLEHKQQLEHLKLEDMDSLALDLEILQQEKQVSDQDLMTLRLQLTKVQNQLTDFKQEASMSEELQLQLINDLKLQLADQEKSSRRIQEQHDDAYNSLQLSQQQRLHELRSHFETEVIPDLNQNHQRRVTSLNHEISSLKTDLAQHQKLAASQKEEITAVQQQLAQLETESQIASKKLMQDAKDLDSKLKLLDIEKQEVELLLVNERQKHAQDQRQLKNQLSTAESESMLIKLQSENLVNDIKNQNKQHEQRCKELVEQREMHKDKCKEFKTQVANLKEEIDQQTEKLNAAEAQIRTLKEQQTQQEDKIFWQLVQQVKQLKNQLNSKESELAYTKNLQQTAPAPVEVKVDQSKNQIKDLQNSYQQEISHLEGQLNQVQKLLDSASAQIKQLLTQVNELQEEKTEISSLYDYQIGINDDLNNQLDDQKRARQQRDQDIHEFTKTIQVLQCQVDELHAQLASQKSMNKDTEIKSLTNEIVNLQTQLAHSESLAEQKDTEIANLRTELSNLQTKSESQAAEISNLEAQVFKLEGETYSIKVDTEKREEQTKVVQGEIARLEGEVKAKQLELEEARNEMEEQLNEFQGVEEKYKEKIGLIEQKLQDAVDQLAISKSSQVSLQTPSSSEEVEALKRRILTLEEREQQFKEQAIALAKKAKEKVEAEREKLTHASAERDGLKKQVESLRGQQLSIIEYFEQSKDFSVLLDKTSDFESQVLENLRRIELNYSRIDEQVGSLTSEKRRVMKEILKCLKKVGIQTHDIETDDVELTFDLVLSKLEDLLTNYNEDQRQLKQILGENQKLHSDNENLNNANYDLRYELQQANIKLDEISRQQVSVHQPLNQSYDAKPDTWQKKYTVLQEESSAMKQDLFGKIGAYEDQIAQLKHQLNNESFKGPSIKADKLVSAQPPGDKYADMSLYKSTESSNDDAKSGSGKTQYQLEQNPAAKPKQQQAVKLQQQPSAAQPQSQGGGLFNSIASFFLTESELKMETKRKAPGEESEYEYYEEYDQEDANN